MTHFTSQTLFTLFLLDEREDLSFGYDKLLHFVCDYVC